MPNNVARGTLLGIAGQGWHLITAFLLYAFLARQLGPAGFGHWRVVLSVLAWFEIFVNAGLIKVATKAISEAPDDRHRLTRAAYLGQLFVALAAFGIVLATAGPIADLLSNPALATLIRIAALDIPLYGLFMVASADVLGVKRFERQAFSWIVYATAKAALIAGLVIAGFSVSGALVGNALSSLVGLAAVFLPSRGDRESMAELWALTRHMLVAAVPFLALSLVEGLGQGIDLWTVSAVVRDGALVGVYASATVIAEVPTFLFIGLNRVLLPAVAGAAAEGDIKLAGHYATQGVRLAVMVTVLGMALVASTGGQALDLVYGRAFAGALLPLTILMAAAMGRTVRSTCTEVLMALNRRRVALAVLFGTVVLEGALLVALTGRYGLAGAAVAAAVGALIAAGAAMFGLRDALASRPLATLARCLVAAAIVGGALALLAPSPISLLVVYPVAAGAYLALLWLLREFDAEDVDSIATALGRRRPDDDADSAASGRPTRRLIVNADDLGWSRSVNRGIVEAHVRGIVTSASILATGAPGFDDAVELARTTPSLDVGVHLNLYRGPSILPPGDIPSLTGGDGRFLGSAPRVVWRLTTGRFDRREIAAEFGAQIEAVRAAGITPTHLDSDKHFHLWPSVFRVVCELAVEHGIDEVRVVREPFTLHPIPLVLNILSIRDARLARSCGLTVPDGTIGVAVAPTDTTILSRLLARARGETVELIVHPGYLDDEFWALQDVLPNRLTIARKRELEVLTDPEARLMVERHGRVLAGHGRDGIPA
jgi:predicted glycoside hydrolase/deacetylase ChbG (UPF0249 family)/O-antigen/teichoic acid export membrane protein